MILVHNGELKYDNRQFGIWERITGGWTQSIWNMTNIPSFMLIGQLEKWQNTVGCIQRLD